MAATMADVARLAGVSKKTVSNYFSGYPYMTPATRARIAEAIAALNYTVNVSARNLSAGRTGQVMLALPELAQPYFAELAQAVVVAAERAGLGVSVVVTNGERDRELALLRGERGRVADGVLLAPLALGADDLAAATIDVPLVLIGDRANGDAFDFVTVENVAGAEAMARLLLGSGRRRIAVLGAERSPLATAAASRFRGVEAAHAAAGVPLAPELVVGPLPFDRRSGAEAVAALVDAGVGFDAVFGLNDALALGALSALQHRGVRVPGEVAVVGFDDVDEAAYATPGLTTVDPGRAWTADRAVGRLVERIGAAAPPPPAVLVAPFSIAERGSH